MSEQGKEIAVIALILIFGFSFMGYVIEGQRTERYKACLEAQKAGVKIECKGSN